VLGLAECFNMSTHKAVLVERFGKSQ